MRRSTMRLGANGKVRPEYWIWRDIKQRCYNSRNAAYKNYGARGLRVCIRWHTFDNFLADMGQRPPGIWWIERKDNDMGYSPQNCEWASIAVNSGNRRDCIRVQYQGETRCLADWARRLRLNYRMVQQRIAKLGWTVEHAFTIPKMQNGGRYADARI